MKISLNDFPTVYPEKLRSVGRGEKGEREAKNKEMK
jgi:hypothetical protein